MLEAGERRGTDLTAGGQSVAQTCRKARQSVAQLPGRFFFWGSSFLPSASIGCLGALLGRQTSTVALEEKRKRGDSQEVRKGMKTGDAELGDARVTGQRGKECRATGSQTGKPIWHGGGREQT